MSKHPVRDLRDVFAARANVYRYLKPTPLHDYAGLSSLIGADVWVKHENHHPVGAFKVRGGLTSQCSIFRTYSQFG
jgi:threonine dehydratase